MELSEDLAFEARTEAIHGRVECGLADAEAVMKDNEIVGCRRGTNGARIDISSARGSISLGPVR